MGVTSDEVSSKPGTTQVSRVKLVTVVESVGAAGGAGEQAARARVRVVR
jgi:hypothetical protein